MKLRPNDYGTLVSKYPILANPKGFSIRVAQSLGVSKQELQKSKGFICVGLVREFIQGNNPHVATSQWWVYDEKTYKMGRLAHRNVAKYGEEYQKLMLDLSKRIMEEKNGTDEGSNQQNSVEEASQPQTV